MSNDPTQRFARIGVDDSDTSGTLSRLVFVGVSMAIREDWKFQNLLTLAIWERNAFSVSKLMRIAAETGREWCGMKLRFKRVAAHVSVYRTSPYLRDQRRGYCRARLVDHSPQKIG